MEMSKEEAIKEFQSELKWAELNIYPYISKQKVEADKMAIEALKQKVGHWIDTGSGQICSRCGEIQYGYDNFRRFCASCGAKMIEPQTESEE